MRCENHLRFGINFLPRPSDTQEREEKNSWMWHMFKILNFVFKGRAWNGFVLSFYFDIKRRVKPLGMQKRLSCVVWQIKKKRVGTNNWEGEKGAVVRYRNRNRWWDKERQRSREKPAEASRLEVQNRASLLFWEQRGTLQIWKGFSHLLKG